MNIQKKAENPSKNYAVGENWEQVSHSLGWRTPNPKKNRLKSVEISRFEFEGLGVIYF
jgi:hypothetical protein